MSFLPYPPTSTTAAIEVFKQDVGLTHEIVHGSDTATVLTEGGAIPTINKLIKDINDRVGAGTGADITLRNDLAAANSNALVNSTNLINGVITVNSIKELGELTPVDGQNYRINSFHSGQFTGIIDCVYMASVSKSLHDGGMIIAPEAIQLWGGSFSDLSTLFNWTGLGNGCFVVSGEISVEKFGAVQGQNISVCVIQANKAATLKGTFFTGKGVYDASGRIDLTTSFKGCMLLNFTATSTTDGIRIVRTIPAVKVPVTDLSWLVEGGRTSPLTSYSGYTLVITSDEILTKRFGGSDVYYKNDINLIEVNGGLKYPLDCTYTSTTGLSVKVYQPEKKVIIEGLYCYSKNCTNEFNVLDVIRSNVYLEDFSHWSDNVSRQYVKSACRILTSVGVTISDKCELSDADHLLTGSREGYGINVFISAAVRLYCSSFRCKTNLSGRHGVDVLVGGGIWSSLVGSPLDCHWGTDYRFENLNVYLPDSDSHTIGYAGRDISVSNITIYGGNKILRNRGDTPVIKGTVSIQNINWKTAVNTTGFVYEAGITEATGVAGFWGVVQTQPDNIIIKNISVENHIPVGSDQGLYVLRLPINDIPRTQIKNIVVEDVFTKNNTLSGIFYRRLVLRNEISGNGITIRGSNVILGNLTNNLSIEKINGTSVDNSATVVLDNVSPLAIRADVDACLAVDLTNVDIVYAKAWSATGLPRTETYTVNMKGGSIGKTPTFYKSFAKVSATNVTFTRNFSPLDDWSGNSQVIHSDGSFLFSGFVSTFGCVNKPNTLTETPVNTVLFSPDITFANNGDLTVDWATRVNKVIRQGDLVKVVGELRFTPTFTTSSGNMLISLPLAPKNVGLRRVGNCIAANLLKQFTDVRSMYVMALTSTTDGANIRIQYNRNTVAGTGVTSLTASGVVSGELIELHYEIEYEI